MLDTEHPINELTRALRNLRDLLDGNLALLDHAARLLDALLRAHAQYGLLQVDGHTHLELGMAGALPLAVVPESLFLHRAGIREQPNVVDLDHGDLLGFMAE